MRAGAGQTGGCAWAYFPLTALASVLVIGRDGGPTFLRSEIAHAERVLELTMKTLERLLGRVPTIDGVNEFAVAPQLPA